MNALGVVDGFVESLGVVASGFGQSVGRLVGRLLSAMAPDDHITRTALI